MRTVTCPVCGAGFLMRRSAQRCRRCPTILLRLNQKYVNPDDERAFVWTESGQEWIEILRTTPTT